MPTTDAPASVDDDVDVDGAAASRSDVSGLLASTAEILCCPTAPGLAIPHSECERFCDALRDLLLLLSQSVPPPPVPSSIVFFGETDHQTSPTQPRPLLLFEELRRRHLVEDIVRVVHGVFLQPEPCPLRVSLLCAALLDVLEMLRKCCADRTSRFCSLVSAPEDEDSGALLAVLADDWGSYSLDRVGFLAGLLFRATGPIAQDSNYAVMLAWADAPGPPAALRSAALPLILRYAAARVCGSEHNSVVLCAASERLVRMLLRGGIYAHHILDRVPQHNSTASTTVLLGWLGSSGAASGAASSEGAGTEDFEAAATTGSTAEHRVREPDGTLMREDALFTVLNQLPSMGAGWQQRCRFSGPQMANQLAFSLAFRWLKGISLRIRLARQNKVIEEHGAVRVKDREESRVNLESEHPDDPGLDDEDDEVFSSAPATPPSCDFVSLGFDSEARDVLAAYCLRLLDQVALPKASWAVVSTNVGSTSSWLQDASFGLFSGFGSTTGSSRTSSSPSVESDSGGYWRSPSKSSKSSLPRNTRTMKLVTSDAVEAVTLEALRLLCVLCTMYPQLTSQVFARVKRFSVDDFNRHIPRTNSRHRAHASLGAVEFLLRHHATVIFDVDPVIDAFFLDYFAIDFFGMHRSNALAAATATNVNTGQRRRKGSGSGDRLKGGNAAFLPPGPRRGGGGLFDSILAYEVLRFCLANQKRILLHTSLFERHFPTLLQIVAWHPHSFASEAVSLVSLILAPNTCVALLHALFDLPLLAVSMEALRHDHSLRALLRHRRRRRESVETTLATVNASTDTPNGMESRVATSATRAKSSSTTSVNSYNDYLITAMASQNERINVAINADGSVASFPLNRANKTNSDAAVFSPFDGGERAPGSGYSNEASKTSNESRGATAEVAVSSDRGKGAELRGLRTIMNYMLRCHADDNNCSNHETPADCKATSRPCTTRTSLQRDENSECRVDSERSRCPIWRSIELRNCAARFADSTGLSSFSTISPRARAVCGLVAPLLVESIDILLRDATERELLDVLPVLFERCTLLFGPADFRSALRTVVLGEISRIFKAFPHFLAPLCQEIVERITAPIWNALPPPGLRPQSDSETSMRGSDAQKNVSASMSASAAPNALPSKCSDEYGIHELALQVVWLVGEFYDLALLGEQRTAQLLDALELLAYHLMSTAQAECVAQKRRSTGGDAAPMPLNHAFEVQRDARSGSLETRLLHVLIAALTKLGARNVDLAPRACLCIAKVVSCGRSVAAFHPSVEQRANIALRALKSASVTTQLMGGGEIMEYWGDGGGGRAIRALRNWH